MLSLLLANENDGLLYCVHIVVSALVIVFFFFQAEDGIRDLVRSRGLGDVYKRQPVVFLKDRHRYISIARKRLV